MKKVHILYQLYLNSEQKGQYFVQTVMIVLMGLLSAVSSLALGYVTQGIVNATFHNMLYVFAVFVCTSLLAAILDWVRSTRLTVMVERIKSVYRQKTRRHRFGFGLRRHTGNPYGGFTEPCIHLYHLFS